MALIAASILDADYGCLRHEVERVAEAGVDAFTIDIMDGNFAPRITIGDQHVAMIRAWINLPIEVHLMVNNPLKWAQRFCDAGADLVVFHAEAAEDPMAVVDVVRAEGRSVGVALLSETPVSLLSDQLLSAVDLVNLLAVPVGFGGAGFAANTQERATELRRRFNAIGRDGAIEVDGGVKPSNAEVFVADGLDMLTVGTGIYHASDAREAVVVLKKKASGGNPIDARRRLALFLSRPSQKRVHDVARHKAT